MDQTLLKYWKTCLQDAERKAIAAHPINQGENSLIL